MAQVDTSKVLEVRDWRAQRPGGFALEVPSLGLRSGGAVALMGPSGAGKTTVLLGLLGLCRPEELTAVGEVEFCGEPWPKPNGPAWRALMQREVTLVLQDARAALDPVRTLLLQIQDATGATAPACDDAMRELGVENPTALLDRHPHEVSGGQAQRALLAVVPRLRARTDLTLRVDHPLPRHPLVLERVQGVSDLPRMPRQPRERRDLSVRGHPSPRDAASSGPACVVSLPPLQAEQAW